MTQPPVRILSRSDEPFADRRQAGRLLASALEEQGEGDVVVLGIPRGGVVVAREVARHLGGQLDIVLARKIGAPGNPEYAIGAISESGHLFVDQRVASAVGAGQDFIQREESRQLEEIRRRAARFRAVRPKIPLSRKTVIVTDDGLATGETMRAALRSVRQESPSFLIGAVPVAPEDTLYRLAPDADLMVCLRVPPYFAAVGQFYLNFAQTEDDEVLAILGETSPTTA